MCIPVPTGLTVDVLGHDYPYPPVLVVSYRLRARAGGRGRAMTRKEKVESPKSIREFLSPEDRALPLIATVDPGFVNRRRVETWVGADGMRLIDERIRALPPLPHLALQEVRIDHAYKDILLAFCRGIRVPGLAEILGAGNGRLFCSIERLAPCPNFYDVPRAVSKVMIKGMSRYKVELHYSTANVRSDTLRSRLRLGSPRIAIVAELYEAAKGGRFIFDPLLMGFPWLDSDDPHLREQVLWWKWGFWENFIEDFDEFKKVLDVPAPEDFSVMRLVPEHAFKWALGRLLGDPAAKDWGGETSDHFTSRLHLNGKRQTAAFLLKGPARFAPMGLNHLGKNNDQILRLAREPADILVVQHCHEILPAVRETLRTFAVRPHEARRYCLIDGRDSLRLLTAYGLLEQTIARSQ